MISVRRRLLAQQWAQDIEARYQRLTDCPPYDDRVDEEWRRLYDTKLRRALMQTLRRQHRCKCVYCETPGCAETIEHYLPKKQFPLHTLDWQNLALACGTCQTNKKEPIGFKGVWPLIVDPTQENVEAFFYVSPETGRIIPALHLREGQLEWERAHETISRLKLNERGLPHQRRRVALELRDALEHFRSRSNRNNENALLRKLGRGQPWSGINWQIMADPQGSFKPLVDYCLEHSPRIRQYCGVRNRLM